MKTQFVCSACGYQSPSWYGKCPECQNWNTFQAQQEERRESKSKLPPVDFVSFDKLSPTTLARKETGTFEFDRVLGSGFIAGETVLLAGEPGVGKSTLLLASLEKLQILYVSGEESGEQIKQRAARIGRGLSNFFFTSAVSVEALIQEVKKRKLEFDAIVIDSIQTIYSADIPAAAGSPTQIREVAMQLNDFAKQTNTIIIFVGHITKGGEIAGPKILEHLVDCVLYFEGEKSSPFRILRAYKNRFGSVDEVGVFEMKSQGLVEVKNPTVFLEDTSRLAPGKATVAISEGSRSLFFEVQSLASPSILAVPRRIVSGFDYNKVQLILAVLKKNLRLPLDKFDIYINVVGGVSIKSTAADLGVAAAVVSSMKNLSLPSKSVFIGEVGLLGEIREIAFQDKVIKEAKRYGFAKIYSSANLNSISLLAKLFT